MCKILLPGKNCLAVTENGVPTVDYVRGSDWGGGVGGINRRRTTDMRLALLAGLVVSIGCMTTSAASSTPKEVVQNLQTAKGQYVIYTKPEQVKTIKGALTPQLYSALLDWSTWLQKAYKAIPETDYDAQMMMPMNANPFFGESDQTGDRNSLAR